MKKLMKQFNSH